MKRRDALKTIGAMAGAAGAATILPGGCDDGSGGLPPGIHHIVVVMMEKVRERAHERPRAGYPSRPQSLSRQFRYFAADRDSCLSNSYPLSVALETKAAKPFRKPCSTRRQISTMMTKKTCRNETF